MFNNDGNSLKTEVSPVIIAIAIGGLLAVMIAGYFIYQSFSGPKFLTGKGGGAAAQMDERAARQHKDDTTGLQTTKD